MFNSFLHQRQVDNLQKEKSVLSKKRRLQERARGKCTWAIFTCFIAYNQELSKNYEHRVVKFIKD